MASLKDLDLATQVYALVSDALDMTETAGWSGSLLVCSSVLCLKTLSLGFLVLTS